MDKELKLYKTEKLIYTLMFDNNRNKEENTKLFDINILKSLKNIIEYHADNNELSKEVIENIQNFVMKARWFEDTSENKKIRSEILNDIIGIMNLQKEDKSLNFYRFELYKRRNDYAYIDKVSGYEILKEKEEVHKSICFDLAVLVSHSDAVSDEEFENYFLDAMKLSLYYYESLNAMIIENPVIFKNEKFYSRMKYVLQENSKLYDKRKMLKYHKNLIKRVDKEIKESK